MSKKNTATVLPFTGNSSASIEVSAEPFTSVILHGEFTSDAARDEFMQAVTMHGVTFLRCANSPLPHPSIDDLSLIERLARTLNKIWPRQAGKAVRS